MRLRLRSTIDPGDVRRKDANQGKRKLRCITRVSRCPLGALSSLESQQSNGNESDTERHNHPRLGRSEQLLGDIA